MHPILFKAGSTDTRNEAGGTAYSLPPDVALAQLVATGSLGNTFYAKAGDHLDHLLTAAKGCPLEFVGQCAVYGRKAAAIKDAPAVLAAYLAVAAKNDGERSLANAVFKSVIDNGRMLRNFVQILRSGKLGRRSLASFPKRLVRNWFASRNDDYLFRQSVGNDPSIADVIKMAHPRPETNERRSLYGYLIGKKHDPNCLPPLVKEYEEFKDALNNSVEMKAWEVPRVPFQMVDSLALSTPMWKQLFKQGSYQFVRMNLNTAKRQGVLDDPEMVAVIVAKLMDPEALTKARQFPYQLLAAYKFAESEMPREIVDALHWAAEASVANVPSFDCDVVVAVDSSGSMGQPSTGRHGNRQSSKMSCADIAGLFAAAVVRKNPCTTVIAFDHNAVIERVEPRDTLLTTAKQLAKCGGATDCSAPIRLLNEQGRKCDLFVIISDDQSWVDSGYYYHRGGSAEQGRTSTLKQWDALKKRCPKAKMVRINIVASTTAQAPAHRDDTLLVGGFSDAVFDAVVNFQVGQDWVDTIKRSVV